MASRGQGSIALRLALAFVVVAVLAVVIVAGLAVVFSERDISALLQQRRNDLTRTLSLNAVSTYNTGQPGWRDVDLKPALALAASSGTAVAILDQNGHVVASNLAGPERASGVVRRPLTLNGQRIGTLLVKFSGRGLVTSADNLRASLARAVIGAAGLAALLALLVALLVSRRITRPVTRLIESARAMSSGNRQARVGPVPGAPAELRDLAVTFDQMADTLGAQEQLRRNLVADVAHELRTPVAVLQANTEALLDGIVPHTPEQTAALHEEVLRLGRMVDDLQTLAAAEAAALQLSLKPCDLAVIAAAAADDWEASFAAAGVRFEPRLEPTPVQADPGQAAPGHREPAEQCAEIHSERRPGPADSHPGRRPGPPAGQRHRTRHRARGPAACVRKVLARRSGRADGRQRHRAGRGRRAGPGPAGND